MDINTGRSQRGIRAWVFTWGNNSCCPSYAYLYRLAEILASQMKARTAPTPHRPLSVPNDALFVFEELARIPESPVGPIEISDSDLGNVLGGTTSVPCVGITVGLSSMIHCADSILHGSCSGFSIGCCS